MNNSEAVSNFGLDASILDKDFITEAGNFSFLNSGIDLPKKPIGFRHSNSKDVFKRHGSEIVCKNDLKVDNRGSVGNSTNKLSNFCKLVRNFSVCETGGQADKDLEKKGKSINSSKKTATLVRDNTAICIKNEAVVTSQDPNASTRNSDHINVNDSELKSGLPYQPSENKSHKSLTQTKSQVFGSKRSCLIRKIVDEKAKQQNQIEADIQENIQKQAKLKAKKKGEYFISNSIFKQAGVSYPKPEDDNSDKDDPNKDEHTEEEYEVEVEVEEDDSLDVIDLDKDHISQYIGMTLKEKKKIKTENKLKKLLDTYDPIEKLEDYFIEKKIVKAINKNIITKPLVKKILNNYNKKKQLIEDLLLEAKLPPPPQPNKKLSKQSTRTNIKNLDSQTQILNENWEEVEERNRLIQDQLENAYKSYMDYHD